MKKHSALLVVLLLLIAITAIRINHTQDPSEGGNGTSSLKNRADRERVDSTDAGDNPEARARRLSPPGWEPPAVFAEKGTPSPAIIFPRGENASRRYHGTKTIDLDPSLASLPPAILAQSPADGRFHLLPDEIDVHTRLARRMVLDPSALDSIVRQNTSRLLAPTIGDEVLTLEFKKVKSRDANTHTLTGHIVGEESTSDVQLVYHDGILQGNVARYTASQEIEYRIMADGHMMVRELDQSTMTEECGNGPSTQAEAIIKELSEQGISIEPKIESVSSEVGSVEGDTVGWRLVDVVVGYDAAARVAQGGYSQIEALIIASVDRMTTAYANSSIPNTETVLLGTIEDPNYVYPGRVSGEMGSSDELGDLDNRTNGALDTVTNYATQVGADLVSFVLRDTDGSAGIAYMPGRSSIVARTYMTSTRITFAHELGHNLGCDHSWGDSSQSYHSRYGWRLDVDGSSATTSDRVRTIMAYDWSWGAGTRIPYFANPGVSYNGAPTGAPNGHDVRTSTKGDQRYYQNGLSYSNGTFGFDGNTATLGANNANLIHAGTGSFGATAASNRSTRTAFNVTSPTTGALWTRGSTRTVFFTGGDEDDLATIDLYKGGMLHTTLATNRNVATGRSFAWAIPANHEAGTDYMIRVTMTRNGSTITADSGTFTINDPTPMVIAQAPLSSTAIIPPFSQITLTFNMAMDPASFTVADDVVSFTGPGSTNLKPSITSATWSSGNTVLTLAFPPQSSNGSYQLVLGSQILSSTGVLLNQDQDTNPGESTQDRYTASFLLLTLADALDTTGLTWTTSGNAAWFPQTTTTQDGADAAQSGAIGHSQSSSVQTTLMGPGTLTYFWRVSSESGFDFLQFFINDVLQTGSASRISGEVAWTQVSVPIAAGAQTARWTYQKDGSLIKGLDTAWLDRVVYTPAATYTVTYDGNGNTGGTPPVDASSPYANGSTVTVLNAGDLTKTSSIFTGWNTAANGSGTAYAPNATFSINANTTLYAQWGPMPLSVVTNTGFVQVPEGGTATFQVKLSQEPTGNGPGNVSVTVARSSGDADINITSGSSLTFNKTTWDTWQNVTLSAANDADAANGSATFTCTAGSGGYADTNVLATETDKDTTLTISNDGNGSTTPSGAVVVQKNAATAISATPTVGYEFVNWTVTSGSAIFGNASSASTTVTTGQPTTIRANFAIRRYTLTYNAGTGGTILGDSPQTVNHGSDGTEVEAVASPGYTFAQWSDNVTNALRTDTAVTGNLNVTAQFSANIYTVTFDANGGSAANPVSKPVTFGSPYGTLPSSTRSGYSFDGWFTAPTGGVKMDASSNVVTADNHTLYARWIPDTYIVSYNGNGNTGGSAPANQDKLHDVDLTLRTNTGGLSKTGYSFTGWNTAPDGTGTDYPAGSTYSGNTPITLHAKWTLGNDGTWLPTAAGPFNWSDPANWSGGIIASGADRTASFTANITADQTAHLDSDRTIGNITFNDASHNLTLSGTSTLSLARSGSTPVIDVTTSGRTITISSNIAGANGLQKNGAGKLTLSGTNTFGGGVSINAGTLQIASAAGLGSGNSVTFAGNGTLEFSSNATLSQGFAINSGVVGILNGYNRTIIVNNSLAGSGTLRALNGGDPGSYFEFTSTNNTFSGNIEIYSASGGLYSAGLVLASLADTPGSRIKLGNNSSTAYFTYGAGAVVPLVLNNRQIEHYASNAALNNNATNVNSTVTVNTGLLLSRNANVPFTLGGSNTGNNTFAGAIGDRTGGYQTSLTKANAGKWIVSNDNTFTGSVSVSGGTLVLSGTNQYIGPTVLTGGTLEIASIADGGTASSMGKASSNPNNLRLVSGSPTLRYTGDGDSTNRNFALLGSATIDSSGTDALVFSQTGTISPDDSESANFATGQKVVTGLSSTADLAVGMRVTGAGIAANSTIASIDSASQITLSTNTTAVGSGTTLSFGYPTARTLTLTGTNTAANTIAGVLQNSTAAGTGVLSMTKSGIGTWVLSGANTYTGATTISGGKFFINGDQTLATGNVSVAANATLGGTGIIGGNTTIAADGRLEFDLSTNAASHNNLELASGKSLTFSGASTLTITSSSGAVVGTYTLLSAPGGITGNAPATLVLPSGWAATVSKVGTNLVLNVTSVGALTPFEQWAVTSGLSGGNAASGADPDGDGLTNLQEFAFDTNPTGGRPGPIQIDQSGRVTSTGLPDIRNFAASGQAPAFRAVFPRRKDHLGAGITYTVEFSADLTRWTASNTGLEVLSTESAGNVDAVSVPFPLSVPVTTGDPQPPKFFRVHIATTP